MGLISSNVVSIRFCNTSNALQSRGPAKDHLATYDLLWNLICRTLVMSHMSLTSLLHRTSMNIIIVATASIPAASVVVAAAATESLMVGWHKL